MTFTAERVPGGLRWTGPTGAGRTPGGTLRLERREGGLRLGDAAGVPRARLRTTGEESAVHDAGGLLIAVARLAGGRVVVSNRDGKTIGFVTGAASVENAALAFVPGLGADERAEALLGAIPSRP